MTMRIGGAPRRASWRNLTWETSRLWGWGAMECSRSPLGPPTNTAGQRYAKGTIGAGIRGRC